MKWPITIEQTEVIQVVHHVCQTPVIIQLNMQLKHRKLLFSFVSTRDEPKANEVELVD